jgi:cytochrome c-type biogenesis protein CcmE
LKKTKKPNLFKRKRVIFVSIIFLISIIGLLLIIGSFKENIIFFYSPSELQEKIILEKKQGNLENFLQRSFRAGGMVKDNSIKNIGPSEIEFTITDYQQDLQIYYKGITPDLFRQKQGIVAFGKYNLVENKLIAEEILIKHDENYMPPEIKNSLKKPSNNNYIKGNN